MRKAKKTHTFEPDFAVPPGETLKEVADSLGMSQKELADRTGLTVQTINRILKGDQPITFETANRLELTTGVPARMWNNLESQYREQLAKIAKKKQLEAHQDWLKRLPIKQMAEMHWVTMHADGSAMLEEMLRFFALASPDQWETVWRKHQASYRQTHRFETRAETISAWLRKGEIEAQKIPCGPFNAKAFRDCLESLRELTGETLDVFSPVLRDRCAPAGVAVVIVPELPKTGVYGATRWIGEKAVIQLSMRYKSNDQLWFTFFHEAGHILKHGRKDVFIETNGPEDEQEKEADAFAQNQLIPPGELRRFLAKWDHRSLGPIERFAERIGIAPGIVVGRLQHDGLLPKSHGNGLKVFFK